MDADPPIGEVAELPEEVEEVPVAMSLVPEEPTDRAPALPTKEPLGILPAAEGTLLNGMEFTVELPDEALSLPGPNHILFPLLHLN
jgi:hypothetical protein